MRRLAIVSLLINFFLALRVFYPASAQAQFVESWAEYRFNEEIVFYARLRADAPPTSAHVFFQAHADTRTVVGEAQIQAQEDDVYLLSYTHLLADYHLRAFSQVDFRWEIVAADGEKMNSPAYEFFYEDNRYQWNSLEESPFRVHWFEGDVPYAQSIIDAAEKGFFQAQTLLPIPKPQFMEIYIYPDSNSLQAALQPNSRDWVAGHAEPDLGVIVAALPSGPDQEILIQQRIPHELMHILLYQYIGGGYDNLPVWLSEGLASLTELYPNADYELLLKDAVGRKALIPMAALCQTFPRDASNALLAYAQSTSFTRYLHGVYGVSGMHDLVAAYANGLSCERGVQKALGRSLSQLERNWRSETLAEDMNAAALDNLRPWWILLGVVLIAPLILVAARWLQLRLSPNSNIEQTSG
ncbi:MAG: peptidase MA family metallohydrolase [Anaerolineales bacterium]|nr:peptidase MA family metallohydrolase [Anaerolineales bacterium]